VKSRSPGHEVARAQVLHRWGGYASLTFKLFMRQQSANRLLVLLRRFAGDVSERKWTVMRLVGCVYD
jgi:hypothetical protein